MLEAVFFSILADIPSGLFALVTSRLTSNSWTSSSVQGDPVDTYLDLSPKY